MGETFRGIDFYDTDSLLSPDERAVRDGVREWVEAEVLPIIDDCYLEGRFPEELIPRWRRSACSGRTYRQTTGARG